MKSHKISIFLGILLLITALSAILHFHTRKFVPDGFLEISDGNNSYQISLSEIPYTPVTGTRTDGKGTSIPVNGEGILLRDLLELQGFTDYQSATVIAEDSYTATVHAEEIAEDSKVYLLNQENSLRLIVFGDLGSKRNVSHVVTILLE